MREADFREHFHSITNGFTSVIVIAHPHLDDAVQRRTSATLADNLRRRYGHSDRDEVVSGKLTRAPGALHDAEWLGGRPASRRGWRLGVLDFVQRLAEKLDHAGHKHKLAQGGPGQAQTSAAIAPTDAALDCPAPAHRQCHLPLAPDGEGKGLSIVRTDNH